MLDIEAFSHSESQNYRGFEKWPKSAKNSIFYHFDYFLSIQNA